MTKDRKVNVQYLALFGFILRLVVIVLGKYADSQKNLPPYTDLDYHIFSDAARHVLHGESPYERATYRYPPYLAWINVPNHIWFPEFGKIVFAIFDSLIIICIYVIGKKICPKNMDSKIELVSKAWMLNPIAINICTRGSSDSIVNFGVLTLLYYLYHGNDFLSAICLGWLIYWRLFPIIYLPPVVFYILSRNRTSNNRSKVRRLLWFSIVVFCTTILLVGISLAQYGFEYLDHAVFYHVTRKDHRHNFAPHFLGIYLTFLQTKSKWNQLFLSLISLISQGIPNLTFSFLLGRGDIRLGQTFLLVTMSFVAFNKVITAQYFMWFLCLMPIAFIEHLDSHSDSSIADDNNNNSNNIIIIRNEKNDNENNDSIRMFLYLLIWLLSLLSWLLIAYMLEFQGSALFESLWFASIVFHGITIFVILKLFTVFANKNNRFKCN